MKIIYKTADVLLWNTTPVAFYAIENIRMHHFWQTFKTVSYNLRLQLLANWPK